MTVTSRDGVSSQRTLAWLVVVGLVAYVAIDVALAFLRRDYSLVHNAESDYGRGRHDWLMDINFVLRGAFSAVAVLALRRARPTAPVWCLWLLGGWALCSALLAAFPDNPTGYPHHPSGSVHLVLAFVAFTAIVVASVVIAITRPAWAGPRWVRSAVFLTSGLGVVAYLVLPRVIGRQHAPGGVVERIFLAAELAWLVIVVLSLATTDVVDRTASLELGDAARALPRRTLPN
ncbi:MAG: DUF998 domain-containing protein [Acidothermaceae bacterium]